MPDSMRACFEQSYKRQIAEFARQASCLPTTPGKAFDNNQPYLFVMV